jgi:uncharacterized protein involved in oxidation of intracellular sulfur
MNGESRQKLVLVVNDGPYGNERAYNGLRLALNLARRTDIAMQVFLVGDGVACARSGQKTPDGYYNVERLIKALARRGEVAA